MDANSKNAASFANKEINRCWSVEEFQGWIKVSIKDRIDSFNYEAFQHELDSLLKEIRRPLALEVSQVRFLSLKAIQYLHEVAGFLLNEGLRPALVAPSEKLKRQIDIYAKLERWEVYRSLPDLATNRQESRQSKNRTEGPFPSA